MHLEKRTRFVSMKKFTAAILFYQLLFGGMFTFVLYPAENHSANSAVGAGNCFYRVQIQ